jgi:hypothetical protein
MVFLSRFQNVHRFRIVVITENLRARRQMSEQKVSFHISIFMRSLSLVVVVVVAVVIVPARTLHGCAGAPRCFPSAIVPVARAAAVGILICLISTRGSSTLCGVSL